MSAHTEKQQRSISRALKAIETIQEGGTVIMIDDEDRENEGDLVFAATDVNADKINFMAKEARGLICLTLEPSTVEKLGLPMMEGQVNSNPAMGTAFTVSIEAREGVTTGISAKDRAQTVRVAVAESTTAKDITVPGHVFPLKAKPGGVLERAGHTEGSVDLVRLAGKKPAAVICEIMKDDGSMARVGDLEKFSQKFELPIVTIEDLITFRMLKESLVEEVYRAPYETSHGTFEGVWFRNKVDGLSHFALVKGENLNDKVVDVRVHKQRPLTDVFSNAATGGRNKIEFGLNMLSKADAGVFVYLTPDNSCKSFIKDSPLHKEQNNQAMDEKLYGTGAQILRSLGVSKMRIHVSSQRSIKGLGGFGLEIVDTNILKKQD